jgi:hypothetical protein
MTSISKSAANRTARALQQVYGPGSATEASDRAEERVANIDIGGFAHWKVVEQLIRSGRASF